ncbi:cytochrome P450 1A2 isoform X1 [Ursus americanus]|nr:cytochrome P450 1A2 isoform X1 [Ursus americanus]
MGTPPPSASRQRGEGWGHLRPQFQGPHGQRRPQLRWGLEEVPRQPEDTLVQMALSQMATELLLASAVFCLVLWVVRAWQPRAPKGLKSPPGPWGWPLLGNVLTLGKSPHLALSRLSQHYGDVLQIRIGSTPVLVLSGLDTIRQALVQQGDDFKGRPDLYSFTLVTDGQSMTFNPDSGPVWAARRRLAQNALKSFSTASNPASASSCYLEEHVSKEAEALLSRLQEQMAEAGRFDPYNHVLLSVANVIGAMCFGQHFPQSSEEMLTLIKHSNDFVEIASSGNPVDFFPILQYMPSPALQRFKAFNQKLLRFLQKIVQEHYRDFDESSVQDITGALLKHSEKGSGASGGHIPHEKIVNLINDIFGAGFDTITTALSWSLMYLVTNPEIQRKIQKELDTVIGRARRPRLSDRPQLPYMEAFILEIFRHTSFVPFTIPHSTTRDTTLKGFYIPKERCVFINQWQVNHDQKVWGDPSEFRPERFLTADGTAINKTLSEKIMIFGMGKRRCIGEVLAKWEIFLFLAILLQQLEFSVPAGVKVDLTPIFGLTMKHTHCEHVQARPRFSTK